MTTSLTALKEARAKQRRLFENPWSQEGWIKSEQDLYAAIDAFLATSPQSEPVGDVKEALRLVKEIEAGMSGGFIGARTKKVIEILQSLPVSVQHPEHPPYVVYGLTGQFYQRFIPEKKEQGSWTGLTDEAILRGPDGRCYQENVRQIKLGILSFLFGNGWGLYHPRPDISPERVLEIRERCSASDADDFEREILAVLYQYQVFQRAEQEVPK